MRFAWLALMLLASACGGGGDDAAADGDPGTDTPADGDDAGVDADEGPGCSAFSPRDTPVEALVMPTGFQARMSGLIDGADTTLDVQMYLFTVQALADRIVAAKNRGVTVRVILDPDHDGNNPVRSRFTSARVPFRDAPNLYDFSHAKYLIADGDTAAILSANFNVDAMDRERNYGVIDRDAADLEDLQAIFDADWARAAGETASLDLSCTRLVVSPTNAYARILQLVNGADTTLDIEAIYVSEPGVRDAVIAAKQRGVTVRAIIDADADDNDNIPVLRAAGIEVREPRGFRLHAKLMIADGVAFVGSENFSVSGLTRNRETGVFVTESGPAQIIQTQFDADWLASQ